MRRSTALKLAFILAAALFIALLIPIIYSNVGFDISEPELAHKKIPKEFDGFKIAQLSDIHDADANGLIDILRSKAPDIIVITGDLIDSPDMDNALAIIREAQKIAPCYLVTGNHEAWVGAEIYGALEDELEALCVTVLHNRSVSVKKGEQEIKIVGIDDPDFDSYGADSLEALCDDEKFTLLLSHRPELFSKYVTAEAELVLSGHAHGGQFRIPLIGGVYAPHQGVFPTYDAGFYSDGDTNMYVSRGIGNSDFPIRINNRPEIVFITLKHQDN